MKRPATNRGGQIPYNWICLSITVILLIMWHQGYFCREELDSNLDPEVPKGALQDLVNSYRVHVKAESESAATLPIILTSANGAYVKSGLLGNMLCSINRLYSTREEVLRQFILLPLDDTTAEYARTYFPEIYSFDNKEYWEGVSDSLLRSSSSASHSYMSFIVQKLALIVNLLHSVPKDVMWTDSDLAWVKDPLPYVQDNPGCDLIMADGQTYVSEFLRRWRPTVNAGFYYARNTPNTKEFFEVWYRAMLYSWRKGLDTKEQPAFKKAVAHLGNRVRYVQAGMFPATYDSNFITICQLPAAEFPKWELIDTFGEAYLVVAHPNIMDKQRKDAELRERNFWYLNDEENICINDGTKTSRSRRGKRGGTEVAGS